MPQRTTEDGYITPNRQKAALIGFLVGGAVGALLSFLAINLASAHNESNNLTSEKKAMIVSLTSFFIGAILSVYSYFSPTSCAQANYETTANAEGNLIINGFTIEEQRNRIARGSHPFLLTPRSNEEPDERDSLIKPSINNGSA